MILALFILQISVTFALQAQDPIYLCNGVYANRPCPRYGGEEVRLPAVSKYRVEEERARYEGTYVDETPLAEGGNRLVEEKVARGVRPLEPARDIEALLAEIEDLNRDTTVALDEQNVSDREWARTRMRAKLTALCDIDSSMHGAANRAKCVRGQTLLSEIS
jgi:hypothetical protein